MTKTTISHERERILWPCIRPCLNSNQIDDAINALCNQKLVFVNIALFSKALIFLKFQRFFMNKKNANRFMDSTCIKDWSQTLCTTGGSPDPLKCCSKCCDIQTNTCFEHVRCEAREEKAKGETHCFIHPAMISER